MKNLKLTLMVYNNYIIFTNLYYTYTLHITFVLDMTLNCIQVYDSITERFFRTPGPWTKYLSVFFFVQ